MSDNGSSKTNVYDKIFNLILTHKIPLGAPIFENELSVELGSSRSPIREALKKMEAQGIVNHYPGRGTFVAPITRHDVEEIIDLRVVLELFCLKTSIHRIPDETLDRIKTQLSALEEGSPFDEYSKTNIDLHETIIAFGGNKRAENFYQMLSMQILLVNRSTPCARQYFVRSRDQHLEIVEALKARDLEKSEDLLRSHLEYIKQNTMESFEYVNL